MEYRTPAPEDGEALSRLVAELGYEAPPQLVARRLQTILSRPDHLICIAVSHAAICGFVHAFERHALERPAAMVVQAIVVEAGCRNSGVGARLMAHVEADARRRGINVISLSSRTERAGAHAFYRRLGFGCAPQSTIFTKTL